MQPDAKADRHSDRLEAALFGVVLLLQSIPLIALRWFPSEDGPSHIGTGEIIAHHDGILAEYFRLDWFVPNASAELLGAGLLRVTSPVTAGRLVLVLCLLLPLAARYAFVALGTSGRWISWLTLPLALGWALHLGLFNYCVGCVVLLFTLGYWFRHEGQGLRATVTLGALLFVLLISHLVPFAVALVLLFVRSFWQLLNRRPGERLVVIDVAAAAAVPSVLAFVYVLTDVTDTSLRQSLRDLVVNLASLQQVILSYHSAEKVAGILVVLAVGLLSLVALRRSMPRRWRDPSMALLAAAGVLLVLYFVLPDGGESGGSQLAARLSLFLFLTLMAWLSQLAFSRRMLLVPVVFGVVASLVLTVVRVPIYSDFEDEVEEYMSIAPLIEENTTVLPVNLAVGNDPETTLTRSRQVRPTIQLAGWLMAERHVVDLSHYEGYYKVNPPRFRSEVDPFGPIGGGMRWIGRTPPDIDILGFSDATHGAGTIDYVLVFGREAASDETLADPRTENLDDQLAEGFELVATSEPRGLVELYRRTD